MAELDLILLHAPSVYDFRKEFLFYGPVSDLVPSTGVFEMYPFGFMTMATALHAQGYKVRIINLASMMLNDKGLDVERLISKLTFQGLRHRPALAAPCPRRLGGGEAGAQASPRGQDPIRRVLLHLLP